MRSCHYSTIVISYIAFPMMTSSNGNIFLVTGHLCGKFTGHRWIPRTLRPATRSFDDFVDLRLIKRRRKQSRVWWFETPLRPLWRHCNANAFYNNSAQLCDTSPCYVVMIQLTTMRDLCKFTMDVHAIWLVKQFLFKTCINHYMRIKVWDIIPHRCPTTTAVYLK